MGFRLSSVERQTLKTALAGFDGDVFLFGSRQDPSRQGGDIDILLKPRTETDRYALRKKVVSIFESSLEQTLDVVVYDDQSIFCMEIIKHAQSVDVASL